MASAELGPYEVDYNGRIVSDDGTIIATLADQTDPPQPVDEKRNANGRLLASSWTLLEVLDEVMQCWEEETSWGDGIHESHEQFHNRAVGLLVRLGKRDGVKPPAFQVGYEEAVKRFEAAMNPDTGFEMGEPDFANPYPEGSEEQKGFSEAVFDLTK